jgi:hypothetical protein
LRLKPEDEWEKIFGESAEAPRRLFVPVYRYRHVDFGGPDIYACGIGPKDRQAENRLCVLLCSLPS